MQLHQAQTIAESTLQILAPHCQIINIAGSIRRQKPEVKDIELVVLPIKETINTTLDMFSDHSNIITEQNCWEFSNAVKSLGTILKGKTTGKYLKIELPQGIMLDLFIPSAHDYYRQYAIRTGSADYSYKIIATGWKKIGWVGTDVGLRKINDCIKVTTPKGFSYKCINPNAEHPPFWTSEEDFFNWLGVPYIPATERNL